MLECQIQYVLDLALANDTSNNPDLEPCVPWFYPVAPGAYTMCDPWAGLAFRKTMEAMPSGQCDECLPECVETKYQAKVTAAPIRKCDFRNLGLSQLCNFDNSRIEPPIWGSSVLDEYQVLYRTTESGSIKQCELLTSALLSKIYCRIHRL